MAESWKTQSGVLISERTHRLMTVPEIFKAYPTSFFNLSGELVYVRRLNRYVMPDMIQWLGKWHSGFRDELFVEREADTDIREETHRLMTVPEVFQRYPSAFFNNLGELIYNKRRNYYITRTCLHYLGGWHPAFPEWLYVKR